MDTPTGPQDDSHAMAALGINAAMLDGDPGLAYRLVADLMADGEPFDRLLFDVLGPLQRDVGTRWLNADYRIAQEHAASATVETVVALLAGSFDMPDDGIHVVVACAEGDNHSLPARMVAAYLTYLGWRVTFLGATLPADDLGGYLAEEQPAALLLSCTDTSNLVGARASIQAAHNAGIPVITGGRGFGLSSKRSGALGADQWIGDPRELDTVFDEWTPDIAAAESQATDSAMAFALIDALPGLVEEAIAQSIPWDADLSLVREDLTLLGRNVAVAVLTDDQSVVDDYLAWHESRRVAHGTGVPTDELATMMKRELSGVDGVVADRLP